MKFSISHLKLIISDFVKKNKKETVLLIIILLVGSFLRLYKIGSYMTFLGDEGRDAIIVRRLLVDFDPILIGPRTSIGDMYLGPMYYYLIAPALLLANFSPVGPSIMVALIGIATIFLVWFVTREWFDDNKNVIGNSLRYPALVAAFLYAISPVVIIHSRSSWNPNIMPFFSLLAIYSVWRVWNKKESKWLIVLAVSFAFVLQSHYLGLLLLPTIILIMLFVFFEVITSKNKIKKSKPKSFTEVKFEHLIKYLVISLGIFMVLMSPLVIFDARHGWRNFASMKKFFTERQTTVSARPWTGIPKFPEIGTQITTRLLVAKDEHVGSVLFPILSISFLVVLSSLLYNDFKKKRLSNDSCVFGILFLWLGFGLLGFTLYKQHIYDHYFGFLFPAPFILIGGILGFIIKNKNILFKIVFIIVLVYITFLNIKSNPLKYHPNRQMQRAMEVAEKIQKEAGKHKFNLAVIAEQNYEDGYQYFLEKNGLPVYDIDPLNLEDSVADQLFVVCEMEEAKCDPTHSAKAEVANFGWSKIEKQWSVSGIVLYKLVHTK